MVPPIIEVIQSYTEAVEKKQICCNLERCPRCGVKGSSFKLHERRRRTFLVVSERLIRKMLSFLTRWKCSLCGLTFILYPDFALPYKRYILGTIFDFSRSYIDDNHTSYRKAVQNEKLPIFYESSREEAIDDRALAPSTLHRWIPLWASLKRTLAEALKAVRARSPTSSVFRRFLPIAPWKYQSQERERLLQDSQRVVRAEEEYRRVFGVSIFPALATLCSWG